MELIFVASYPQGSAACNRFSPFLPPRVSRLPFVLNWRLDFSSSRQQRLRLNLCLYAAPCEMMIKEACEDTSLELRLCPPGDGCYSIDRAHDTSCPPKIIMSKSSNKRVSQPPGVVGWPPVRTSRKNLMTSSNSTKVGSLPVRAYGSSDKKTRSDQENCLYVKINMDGVAIGRKVDLKAYDTYQKLSSAVDELFGGLLAAQGYSSSGISNKQKDISGGILDGTGEYTLVYEDTEGDIILVGDVPWDMFISSAKRLRVLKTSELSIVRQRDN